MEGHMLVCPASRYTYGSTGHTTKWYVSDSKYLLLITFAKFLAYGDFSPTLCILIFKLYRFGF